MEKKQEKIKKCWREKLKEFIDFFKKPGVKEFFRYGGLGIWVGLSLYSGTTMAMLLLKNQIHGITPIRGLVALFFLIKNQGTVFQWTLELLATLLPMGIFCYFKITIPRYGVDAIKWALVSMVVFLGWSWISSFMILLLSTHEVSAVNPSLYWNIWFEPLFRIRLYHELWIAGAVSSFILLLLSSFFIKNKSLNIYGNARFAKRAEARRAGLFNNKGLLLGKGFGQDLCLDGYEHFILFAPSGSGKTTSLTMPNLFFWKDSCIVNDIKLTLFKHTSQYRVLMGHRVFVWNPTSPRGETHGYNPLDVISNDPYLRIDEIQKIAAIFIPDNPKSEPIWQVQARFLFTALVLYVLDTKDLPNTLAEVVRQVKTKPDFTQFVKESILLQENIDPLCRYNFLKFCELHEKTRASILATFLSYFELFDNPLVVAATARSDFDIRKLRQERMTIYVGVTKDNLDRLSPLLSIFYQQVADVMTRRTPEVHEPYGVLFLMDEFSALRRMESFQNGIGVFREYHLRVVIIIQELSQLYEKYGRDGAKVFINAKTRMVFTQNDEETCQLVSSSLGDTTAEVKNYSRHLQTGLTKDPHRSVSTQYVKRPLLLPQEVRRLPNDKAILLIEGHEPVLMKKIRWFSEKRFKQKMLGEITLPNLFEKSEQHLASDTQPATIKSHIPVKKISIVPVEIPHEDLDQFI